MEPVKNVVPGYPDTTFGAPPGKEKEILPLPAVILKSHTTGSIITSRWRPQPHEREAIAQGADVYLYVHYHVMVPVLLTTDPPVVGEKDGLPVILAPGHPDYPALTARPGIDD